MEKIILDEQNRNRIQKFIKQELGFYGYEQDIEILERTGELTEELARKVFTEIMNDAHRTRTMLEPEEDSEFREEIEEAFARYDKIPKPEHLEEYGFYDGVYNEMELEDIYSNMQIAFELRGLDNKYYGCRDLRNIAQTVINSIDGIKKYQIELQPEAKEELQRIQEELRTLLSAEKTDIQGIQERIELYNGHATNIWNDYLTDIDDAQNSQYRWVIHNLTKGELEGNFRNKYMSTSLMTNNAMGRYGNSDYGLIIKPKHIVCASYRDTYTLNTRDDEENLFNIRPPLMLPQEIEDICIQQTIEEDGEMLNYETTPIYSQLVVDEFEIEGVYYISYGEHELAKDYERAKKVADISGFRINECGETIRENNTGESVIQDSHIGTDIIQRISTSKKLEQPQQIQEIQTTNMWKNRFQNWYSAIDRVSQSVKNKFVKMKSDIVKAISEKLKEKTNFRQVNNTQEQDTNERQVIHLKQEYKEAFSEVNEIIKMMPDELTNKIPSKFKEMLEDERDKEYNPNIQEPLEKQKLKNETIIILGLIYRDFLCPTDEKRRLQEKDARELQKVQKAIEEEIREKYNPDDIFKNKREIKDEEITEEKSLTVVKEEKWYQKIFNLIKGIFRRKSMQKIQSFLSRDYRKSCVNRISFRLIT